MCHETKKMYIGDYNLQHTEPPIIDLFLHTMQLYFYGEKYIQGQLYYSIVGLVHIIIIT